MSFVPNPSRKQRPPTTYRRRGSTLRAATDTKVADGYNVPHQPRKARVAEGGRRGARRLDLDGEAHVEVGDSARSDPAFPPDAQVPAHRPRRPARPGGDVKPEHVQLAEALCTLHRLDPDDFLRAIQ